MRSHLAISLVLVATLTACVDDEPAPRAPLSGLPPGVTGEGGGDEEDAGAVDGGLEDGGSVTTMPNCVAVTPGGANDILISPPLLGFTPTFAFAAFTPDQCLSGAPLIQLSVTNGPCVHNPDSGLWVRFYAGSVGDTVTVGGPGIDTDGLIFIDFYDGLGNHWCNSDPTFANSIVFDNIGVGTGDRVSTSIFELASLPRCGGSGGPEVISVGIPNGLFDADLTASFAESCD